MDLFKIQIPAPAVGMRLPTRTVSVPENNTQGTNHFLEAGISRAETERYETEFGSSVAELKQMMKQMVSESLSELRIYVSEADITQAQNRVKAIVEESKF